MFSLQCITNKNIPNIDEVYLCERDGRLCCVPYNDPYAGDIVQENYNLIIPKSIDIRRELFQTMSKTDQHHRRIGEDDGRSLMIPVNEPVIKRISRTLFEQGFLEALTVAANDPECYRTNRIMNIIAKYSLSFVDVGNKIKHFFRPHLKEEGIMTITKLSQTRDWIHSIIREIKYHPNHCKMAVAASDDSIRIYTHNREIVQILKNYMQKNITSMSWRPYAASELAIGCQNGILIWSLDPNSNITRPLAQPMQLKQLHKNQFPVYCVEWNPNGTLLASSSLNDSNILIWDVDQNRSTPLKRIGQPCSLLSWSPDGSRLFTSTINNIFRVWTTDKWLPERWTIANGTVQSAAWSPCCNYLMFVTTNESILYCLRFIEEPLFTNTSDQKQALPVADLTKIKIDLVDVGGQPQSIAWDPKGQHIAISFKYTSALALFRTTINRHLINISPSCFLVGVHGEHPSFICFQNKYKERPHTILTIGWSSGRIQFFPIV